MSGAVLLSGAVIFDSESWHHNHALLMRGGSVEIVPEYDSPPYGMDAIRLEGGILVPGFVDMQVNGGGGVMLNDQRDVSAIRTICCAHARFGTTALLATLITDTPAITAEAVAAGIEATEAQTPGFLGLHLEGPHLSIARKGAHDSDLIRPMNAEDLARLIDARRHLPVLLCTIAPESVTPDQVAALAAARVIVSLGHSDCTAAQAHLYAGAGVTVTTHLFNAMSQMGNREPGLVGATLDEGRLSCGIIADGFHVDPITMRVAMRGKQAPGRICLVTDAMATIGTDMTSFTLNGRTIRRQGGRLTLADGTLAGADLDMISAVRLMHETIGISLEDALKMASTYPAQALGVGASHGRLGVGSRADIVHLSPDLNVQQVWISGKSVYAASSGGPL